MTKNVRYALILLAICAVAAFLLALTNSITEPVIAEMNLQTRLKALDAVSGGLEIGEEVSVEGNTNVSYAIALTEGGATEGWILGLRGNGYGGEMTLVASYDLKGEIQRAQLLDHTETPGLGKKAEEPGYMRKFEGSGSTKAVPTSKAMLLDADAQAVSGSTVTFAAIAKALEAGSSYVKNLGGAK
jgi:electron transport complex protein RnfG